MGEVPSFGSGAVLDVHVIAPDTKSDNVAIGVGTTALARGL